jgi:hypothetical protein
VFLIVAAITTLATGEKVMNDIAVADAEAFENRMRAATEGAVQHFAAQKAEVADASVASPSGAPAAAAPAAAVVVAPAKEEEKKEAFKVAGGASVPAPFEEPEAFSSCGAPF